MSRGGPPCVSVSTTRGKVRSLIEKPHQAKMEKKVRRPDSELQAGWLAGIKGEIAFLFEIGGRKKKKKAQCNVRGYKRNVAQDL